MFLQEKKRNPNPIPNQTNPYKIQTKILCILVLLLPHKSRGSVCIRQMRFRPSSRGIPYVMGSCTSKAAKAVSYSVLQHWN